MNKLECIELEYYEFDLLVEKFLGIKGYEVIADEEWHNDSVHLFTIWGINNKLDEWEYDDLNEMITKGCKKAHYMTYALLHELVDRGYIPLTNYLISVCW